MKALLGCLLALAVTGNASACSCRVANLTEFVNQADEIYFAMLQEAKVIAGDFPERWPHIEGKFKVRQILKGPAQPEAVTLTTGMGGGDCGVSMAVARTYIIFKRRSETGIDACSGTSDLEEFQVEEITQKIRALTNRKPAAARNK